MKKIFILVAGVLLLAACDTPAATQTPNTGVTMTETEKFIENFKAQPNIKELPGGVLLQTIKEGQGGSPIATDIVEVHYTGKLINGKVFDSSIQRGEAATFGLNQVIPAWTMGVAQMKKGGKAVLVCPPATAYGERGAGPIPPNSTLIFEIELLDIK